MHLLFNSPYCRKFLFKLPSMRRRRNSLPQIVANLTVWLSFAWQWQGPTTKRQRKTKLQVTVTKQRAVSFALHWTFNVISTLQGPAPHERRLLLIIFWKAACVSVTPYLVQLTFSLEACSWKNGDLVFQCLSFFSIVWWVQRRSGGWRSTTNIQYSRHVWG